MVIIEYDKRTRKIKKLKKGKEIFYCYKLLSPNLKNVFEKKKLRNQKCLSNAFLNNF